MTVCFNKINKILTHVNMQYMQSAIMLRQIRPFIRLSVCLSVCPMPVLGQNERTSLHLCWLIGVASSSFFRYPTAVTKF